MKKILVLFCFCCALLTNTSAQTETYDLITYTPPKGWEKSEANNVLVYTIVNNKTKNWCRLSIVKSTASKGSIEQDFDSEWQDLVVKNYHPIDTAQINGVEAIDGWTIKSAAVPFLVEKQSAIAMLTTISGYERCASIVCITNSKDYLTNIESFLSSVKFKKPETSITENPGSHSKEVVSDNSSVVGVWGKTSTANSAYEMNNGLHSYFQYQYTFNTDGTYSFRTRHFSYMPDIFIGKESGTYKVSGNTVTIIPRQSVLETWTKATVIAPDGKKAETDKLGKLKSSQKRALEKVTYRFTKEYFSGIQEWSLQLSANKETVRDGPFNGSSSFPNTWFYKSITSDVFRVKTD